MKKITLLLALLIFSIGYSQTYDLLESFNGTGLEGAFGGTAAEYATDPDGSDQVVKITSSSAGEIWQGINIVLTSNYKLTNDTQLTMQLEVYSTTAITIAPKAQGGLSGAPDSVTSVDHTGSGWENLTLTFDKSLDGKVPANGIYADFALHINWDTANNNFGASDGRVFYIKNLKGLLSASTNPYDLEAIDFETNGFGASWDWTVDQNGTNPALEFVDNPNKTGANTSDKVAKFTAKAEGMAWALTFTDIPSFTFDDTNNQVKIMVRKDVATDVGIKFERDADNFKEIKVASTVTNGDWEELTFDFSSENGKAYSKLVIIPDFETRTQDNILFFDSITFNALSDNNTGSDTANVVTVDANATWIGYMTVTNPSGANDGFADFWEFDKLKSSFDGNNIVLQPNFNTYANAVAGNNNDRAYWTNSSDNGATAGPLGAKMMKAASFVEPGATFNGKDLTFTGTINANTLSSDYTVKFFIKALDPTDNIYNDVFNGEKIIDLPASGNFSVSATAEELTAGLVIQYGFEVIGLNANPADESALGFISIAPNTLSTASVTRTLVNAYPNPTRNNWTISTGDATATSIEVFNLLGKKIISKKSTSKTTSIDASGLSSGIYLAIIKTSEGSSSLKLIKE